VRAIVLTQAWAGTYSTELLGLLGAEVIQIEARQRPDSWRGDYSGAVPAGVRDPSRRQRPWNTNGLFNAVNLNKRAVTLDLSRPRGRELFLRLVPYADIVAENFSPRVMGNLGLEYAALRRIKPDIILASLSAYGATGPYANVPGIGGTIEPMSGMSALLGYEGGRPQNSGAMYPDPVAGMYGAAAMILALRHRDRTGAGQWIDLGMMEANATFIGDALLEWSANGRVRPRLGNHHPRIAPHNIYRCGGDGGQGTGDGEPADPAQGWGWLAIAAETEEAWRALAVHMGRAGLMHDPRFATMAARKAHEEQLDAVIAAWAAGRDAEAEAAALLALGVSAAPVYNLRTVLDCPQLVARGFFAEVEHPEAGRHLQAGVPWKLSRTPAAVTRPAPMLGEHSREVLAAFLGISDGEYEELVALGITGDMPPE
jgi:crotonobetainyl-CoA:carnitine CoA-transferase CaiB-like acyl-CoA transferase